MKTLIKELNSPEDNNIDWQTIKNHPIGEKVEMIKGLITERLDSDKGLFFRVEIAKGVVIPIHHHKYFKESIVVHSGSLHEAIQNIEIKEFQQINFPDNTSHILIAKEDTLFYSTHYR